MKLRFWGLMAVATALLVSSTLAAAPSPQAPPSKQDRFCVGNCLVIHELGSLVVATVIDKTGTIVSSTSAAVPSHGSGTGHKATAFIDLSTLSVQGASNTKSGDRIQIVGGSNTYPLPGGGSITIIHMASYDVVIVTDASGKVISTNIVSHGLQQ